MEDFDKLDIRLGRIVKSWISPKRENRLISSGSISAMK